MALSKFGSPLSLRGLSLVLFALSGLAGRAHAQCSAPANAIVAENCRTGNPATEWDIQAANAGDLSIQGFSTDISVNPGSPINFKIKSTASAYTINIYRMGYYGGQGARKVATIVPSVSLPQTQPACLKDAATAMTDCGNWSVSASWTVPSSAVSGIYFAHLVRSDTGGDSHIVFVVRNDSSTSAILYQTSDPTWVAYNYYGNGSLYGPGVANFDLPNRTFGVSYNRPILTRGFESEANSFVFGAEFPMVQWLEANGYDVSYSTGVDTDRNGFLLKNHKIFMDSGHDEYVSGPARANIEAARDAGVNLAFFSGNEVFWKTRFANSVDGSSTPSRSLICYKETLAFSKLDPGDPPVWTGTWRDPSFSPPADGGRPENALTGTLFQVNGTGTDNPGNQTIKVPQADGQMRFWRNTAVAALTPGTSYTLVPGSLGYEWDVDADNGARPAGAFPMSTSTYTLTADLLLDYGATYGAGTATHHLMMHRAPSGALIFGAGTINWSWGLNSNHDNPFGFTNPNPDVNMKQATVNLLADMGAQPTTLQTGLRVASASVDVTPPTSVIASPTASTSVSTGSTTIISGNASDSGGVVGGVEVSTDGGVTWHPATGRSAWTYSWAPAVTGSATLMSRAVDDSGNLEKPVGRVAVNVAPQTCPCTIFGANTTPQAVDSGDTNSIEVGVKFSTDVNGSVLGVRFFKTTANTGIHIGHVWTSAGQLLGTATFTGESATGWQQVNFSAPIAVTANTTYIASYLAPKGHYSADSFFFEQAGHDNPPLHALANGVDGADGVYLYGAGGFPKSSFNATNYWVDVLFASSNTYTISGSISGNGGAGASVGLSGPESLSTTADAGGSFSFNGVVNGSYTVSVINPGVTFTPAGQAVTVNFGSVTGVSFSAAVNNPLSLSGNLSGGAGATVSLTGSATQTVTADASGNYSFTGLLDGSYTVTPYKTTYVFNPSSQNIVLSGSSNTQVNFTGAVCSCISIFQATDIPATIDSGDANSVELGLKFKADSPASLSGVRFYKASTNTGTHVGHLWTDSGVLLGTATFPGETASGWQQGYFTTPVQINANTTYIVSYLAPGGHYSSSSNYFQSAGVDRPPLHALANGVDGGNGVYGYTTAGAFPSGSYNSTNYWVDVLYATQAHSITGTISGTAGNGATVTLSGTSTAITTADASGNYQFSGVLAGTYTITPSGTGRIFAPGTQAVYVSAADATGVNFSTLAGCPCTTVWPATTHPASIDGGDPQSVEVGTKIRADADGYVLGVRFYKAAANTGQHTGNLWTAQGTLLATGTFSTESASGWQQLLFPNPVPVVAHTTYVASYFAPAGHYSGDSQFFASAGVDSLPLHALATGVDGPNGVYAYGTKSTYPTSSSGAANYWVDLIYASPTTHSIAGRIAGSGGAGATLVLSGSTTATVTADASGRFSFAGLADGSYTITPGATGYIFSPAQQPVTLNGTHALAVNFSSGAPGFGVSGTVTGGAGITLTLTGSVTQTTIANASGAFAFASVPNGTYTVAPSQSGFAVSPASQNVTVSNGAVANVNFTATALTYSIGGAVSGGAGATVSLSGPAFASTVADALGNYTFAGLSTGTYTLVPFAGAETILVPANLTVTLSSTSITGANFQVASACPCNTIFPAKAIPAVVDFGDASAVELGVKIRVDADAYILGVRFYKAYANTGTHLGRLWTATGTLLGTATFMSESSTGWQQVLFSSPIAVKANTTYIASYFAPAGHYAADVNYFQAAGVDAPPLHALANGTDGPNGVYLAAPNGGFPNLSSANAPNYWVDAIYTPSSTYTIAGKVAGAGGALVTVSLSGASTATTTADSSGSFSFSGLSNGTYTVTPSKAGFAYTPTMLSSVLSNSHALNLSFDTKAGTHTLSGTVTGPGAVGATVALSGAATATAVTDASGSFLLSNLANGNYVLTFTEQGFIFTPASQAITIASADVTANATSVAQTFSITGAISGGGAAGASVKVSGTAIKAVTANANGVYTVSGLAAGAYVLTPSKAGYAFTPASQAVSISTANLTVDFSSAVKTFTLSGTISGAGASGATVNLSGAATASVTTTASGIYSFSGLLAGSYTLTPNSAGFIFSPSSPAVTIRTANLTRNFTSSVQTFTISGNIAGAGGSRAIVTLSGASTRTVTANTSGSFSFNGLTNGSYSVSVSKAGYTFAPAATPVTLSGASVTADFSTQ